MSAGDLDALRFVRVKDSNQVTNESGTANISPLMPVGMRGFFVEIRRIESYKGEMEYVSL